MTTVIPFHFLLLAVGEILKVDYIVTPQDIQNFITREDTFGGIRVPLTDCRLALQLMESSGFIQKYHRTDGNPSDAYYPRDMKKKMNGVHYG